jgi:hypothetical protein
LNPSLIRGDSSAADDPQVKMKKLDLTQVDSHRIVGEALHKPG